MTESSLNQQQQQGLLRSSWQACREEYRNDEIQLFHRLVHVVKPSSYEDEENAENDSSEKGPVVFEKGAKETQENESAKYFEITIDLNELFEWTLIDVYSTARNIELYTSKEREYSQTCRFTEKVGEGSTYQYHCVCSAESHQDGISKTLPIHSKFVIKFLSLDYSEKANKQSKICVSAIVLHGTWKGSVTTPSSIGDSSSLSHQNSDMKESTQFSGSMSSLMSDPRMLMSLMNGLNNPTAKQMSMIFNTIMPITKTIDAVAKEREKEQQTIPETKPLGLATVTPKPIEKTDPISTDTSSKALTENIIQLTSSHSTQFSSKEELRTFVNECVDARMKEWEEKITNKIISEIIGKLSLNPNALSGMLSSFFAGPKVDKDINKED
ncbi:hypothetical protein FDP41_012370 [Naegleria fowleri]|uniref:Uncharacterized protein n=1 Tax=Naegleria fowleri TaxID=5763 RepID=A0A6A5BUE4_NAEFO|nr:uncharacterized protein FDP41_012370 [Naegleria fowleri]KAF0981713.1 hypothetical protein FDP41_012370 [Naegleria fowleri]CAG4712082.1 unnamed protein product [Naegleria fowleri]